MTEIEAQVNRDFKGIWIPRVIWLTNGLSTTEKLLWAEIDSLYCKERDGCYASNEYLATFMGCKERTIRDALYKLRKLNLIANVSFDGRERVIKALQPDDDFERRLSEWRKTASLSGGNPPCTMAKNRQSHTNNINIREQRLDTSKEPPLPSKEKSKPKPRAAEPRGGGGVYFDRKSLRFENISPEFMTLMRETFPGVDIDQQLREMKAWLLDPKNPRRDGNASFIRNWLKKNAIKAPPPYVPEPECMPDDPEFREMLKRRNEEHRKAQEERERQQSELKAQEDEVDGDDYA